jgi:hypothetical protein
MPVFIPGHDQICQKYPLSSVFDPPGHSLKVIRRGCVLIKYGIALYAPPVVYTLAEGLPNRDRTLIVEQYSCGL